MTEARDVFRTLLESATDEERALAKTLCEILVRGTHNLAAIVSGLRESGLAPPGGGEWTEERFREEIARLGAGPSPGPAPTSRL